MEHGVTHSRARVLMVLMAVKSSLLAWNDMLMEGRGGCEAFRETE